MPWSPWKRVEISYRPSPNPRVAIAATEAGRLDLLLSAWRQVGLREMAYALVHMWSTDNGTTWSDGGPIEGWSANPHSLLVLATIGSPATKGLEVIASLEFDSVSHKTWSGSTWSEWSSSLLPGYAFTSWGLDRLDSFDTRPNGRLTHRWVDKADSGQEDLGSPGDEIALPAATSWGPGRLDVFCWSRSGHLWHKWYELRSGGWGRDVSGRWQNLGGRIRGPISACTSGPGRLDVFSLDEHNHVQHKWHDSSDNGWGADISDHWEDLGRPAQAYLMDVAAVSRHAGGTDCRLLGLTVLNST